MQQTEPTFIQRVLYACVLLALITPAQAQEPAEASSDANVPAAVASKQAAEIARGDPPRWYREDASEGARLRSLQKEIGAALQEALGACRRLPAAQRGACAKEARATYQQEMATARAQVAASEPAR